MQNNAGKSELYNAECLLSAVSFRVSPLPWTTEDLGEAFCGRTTSDSSLALSCRAAKLNYLTQGTKHEQNDVLGKVECILKGPHAHVFRQSFQLCPQVPHVYSSCICPPAILVFICKHLRCDFCQTTPVSSSGCSICIPAGSVTYVCLRRVCQSVKMCRSLIRVL